MVEGGGETLRVGRMGDRMVGLGGGGSTGVGVDTFGLLSGTLDSLSTFSLLTSEACRNTKMTTITKPVYVCDKGILQWQSSVILQNHMQSVLWYTTKVEVQSEHHVDQYEVLLRFGS